MRRYVEKCRRCHHHHAEQLLGAHVPADTPLMDAGLDSMAGTELVRRLGGQLGCELPATLLFDHPTSSSIEGYLTSQPRHHDNDDASVAKTHVNVYLCTVMMQCM